MPGRGMAHGMGGGGMPGMGGMPDMGAFRWLFKNLFKTF